MVSVVTRLWAEHSEVQFLLRQEIFSSKMSWATQPCTLWILRILS